MNNVSLILQTYERLRSQTSFWSRTTDVLMVQALMLVATKTTERCDEVIEYWKRCNDATGIFSGLRGQLFNTVGILGMIKGLEPQTIIERTEMNRQHLRTHGLTGFFSNNSIYSKGTALYIAVTTEEEAIFPRMKAIMDGWKKDHPWVTGNNDIFYAFMHALQNSEPCAQVDMTEACFQALQKGGYRSWGLWADELQASAQVVSLFPNVNVNNLEVRYAEVSRLLAEKFDFFAPNIRPTAALLAASDLHPETAIDTLMQYYQALTSGGRETRLLIAMNLVLIENAFTEDGAYDRLLSIIVGLIYAEEVGVVVAAAAATAAT